MHLLQQSVRCMHVLGFTPSEESVIQDVRSERLRHLRAHAQAYYMQTWLVWQVDFQPMHQNINSTSNCSTYKTLNLGG